MRTGYCGCGVAQAATSPMHKLIVPKVVVKRLQAVITGSGLSESAPQPAHCRPSRPRRPHQKAPRR